MPTIALRILCGMVSGTAGGRLVSPPEQIVADAFYFAKQFLVQAGEASGQGSEEDS